MIPAATAERGRVDRRAPARARFCVRLGATVALFAAIGLGGVRMPRAEAASGAASVPARPSSGCKASRPPERGERFDRSIEVGGVERRYVLDVPTEPDPGTPLPLLLDFHGLGHSGAGVWRVSGFRALARRTPFVTAYP
ncbi:MAG: hypothetical protein WCH13_11465, partial [Deltaproteobacteria bacterium]